MPCEHAWRLRWPGPAPVCPRHAWRLRQAHPEPCCVSRCFGWEGGGVWALGLGVAPEPEPIRGEQPHGQPRSPGGHPQPGGQGRGGPVRVASQSTPDPAPRFQEALVRRHRSLQAPATWGECGGARAPGPAQETIGIAAGWASSAQLRGVGTGSEPRWMTMRGRETSAVHPLMDVGRQARADGRPLGQAGRMKLMSAVVSSRSHWLIAIP